MTPIFVACWMCLLPLTGHAQIIANFSDGNTSSEVDGFPGVPGNGWSTGWTQHSQLDTLLDNTVLSTGDSGFDPLHGVSNYLSTNIVNNHSTQDNRTAGISRSFEAFGGIDPATPHTVSFLYRHNTPVTSGDLRAVSFFDGATSDGIAQANTTWLISGQSATGGGNLFFWTAAA